MIAEGWLSLFLLDKGRTQKVILKRGPGIRVTAWHYHGRGVFLLSCLLKRLSLGHADATAKHDCDC